MPQLRLGLYFDLRDPPAWRRGFAEVYRSALELMEEADERGIDSLWLSEHHLFADGHLPQPLLFAAAVAARTRRARIGTAVLLAPLHCAVEIAEQAAVVDQMSGGRLELGLGAGYRVPEYEAFGVDPRQRIALLEDRVQALPLLWADGGVTPTVLQSPLPLWVGAHGPRSSRMAGRLGTGLLSLNPALWEPYLQGLDASGHPRAAARAAGPLAVFLSDDPERTAAIVRPHAEYQGSSYMAHAREGWSAGDPPFPLPPMLRGDGPPSAEVVTVEEAVRRIRSLGQQMNVHHVFMWSSLPGMPDSLVQEHVSLMIDRLAPALRDPARHRV